MNNNQQTTTINPDIIAAFNEVNKNPTAENRRYFFDQLKKAIFLAPVDVDLPPDTPVSNDGTIALPENTSLNFITMQSQDNDIFYPVFTSRDKLDICQYDPAPPTLNVNLADYKPLLNHFSNYLGIVINPLSETICINREMLDAILLENIKPQTLQKESKIRVSDPCDYPQQLIDETIQILEQIPTINKAYLKLMHQSDETSLLIILDIGKEIDSQLIFDVIARNIKAHIPEGQFVDFADTNNAFFRGVITEHKPFYKKKKKTFLNRLFGK